MRRLNLKLNLSFGAKIILLNGFVLLLLAGSLLYIFNELGKANTVILEQQASMKRLEQVRQASHSFSKLRYWITELAVSWQNEAEDKAMANKDKLYKVLSGFHKSDAKKAAKEAKKKAKEAAKLMKKAIRDSSDLGDKSFITFAYTTPFLIEQSLQSHTAQTGYTIGLGRRDLFMIRQMDLNLGLEMNWYDFKSDTTEENFQTLSYFLVAQLDPKFSWYWLPKNMEMGFKMGAGLISPGYGFTAGYSAVFNLSPTPLAIGLVTQFNWVANITSDIPSSYWSSVGLVFGLNFEDKLPSLFDINFPDIF